VLQQANCRLGRRPQIWRLRQQGVQVGKHPADGGLEADDRMHDRVPLGVEVIDEAEDRLSGSVGR
jgi:hypothetical protein